MHPGMLGGIIGGGIGLLGGAVGTYYSIKNTNGPLERRFMIRAAVIAWIGGGVFLSGLFLLPKPYNFMMWVPYGILLPLGITTLNKRLRQIRQQELEPGKVRKERLEG
jgi:hypothetical protein